MSFNDYLIIFALLFYCHKNKFERKDGRIMKYDCDIKEKGNVIDKQSKFFERKGALAGIIIAGVFMIPILICLIVDLASGNGLGWFFIVLAAMFIPTSLFVVPLMAPKNKMFLTMSSFTLSIILLLAVCCIYSGGSWFFVAASSVLFGLTICFAPFIACRRPVNAYLKNSKGLAIMGAYTFTYILMIVCIGLHIDVPGFFAEAFSISYFIVAWLMLLIIRYLPANGYVKAGCCIATFLVISYLATFGIVHFMVNNVETDAVVVYSQLPFADYLVGIGIGVVFVVIGLIVGKSGVKKEENQ